MLNSRPRRHRGIHCACISLAVLALLLSGCKSSSDEPTDPAANGQGQRPTPMTPPQGSGPGNTGSPPTTPVPVPVTAPTQSARQVEYLDRGIVAVASAGGVYISWRVLASDSEDLAFNVYRNGTKLNASPLSAGTNWLDAGGSTAARYAVSAVVGGVEQAASQAPAVWPAAHHSVKLQRPPGGSTPDGLAYDYSPNDISPGDVDGDGSYELIVKWNPSNAKDNSQSGYTGPVYVDAYRLDGTQLWRIDLGKNIRAGAHYTQFIVYDLDGDGKAEVAMKTADGTVDGKGVVIGNAAADYRSSAGYVLTGPEFLTIFEGASGRALHTTAYLPARGTVSSWGDSYGNRVDRFLAGVAYLDGARPSLIMSRGYYTRAVVVAWDWRDGQLLPRWTFDSNNGYPNYAGQGAHSLVVADVDADGRDEIVFGAATIDDNGRGLYSTKLGHGDALHVSDFDPNRPGLEVVMVHEDPKSYGLHGLEMHDAATGTIIWSVPGGGADVGRGVVMDIDARYPGAESWASVGGLMSAQGQQISTRRPSRVNFGIYWDGDLLRETLDDTLIEKWNTQTEKLDRLLTGYQVGAASNNGTKATPGLSADLFGDWREEVVWAHQNKAELLVFTSTVATPHRLPSLMHDTQYRVGVAGQNVGYNQPPHTRYFLGDGMATPPRAEVFVNRP